jgi:hypothetical protein
MKMIRVLRVVLAAKKLKGCILIFSFVLISLGVMSSPKLATKQQIGLFKNSITCVVLEDGMSLYNQSIKAVVSEYWKTTDYELIDQKEFEKRRHSTRYSFLVLMKGVFDKDPGGVSYNYLSLVLGDGSNNMTNMPELCSIPISYTGDNFPDYQYALPAIIRFMQKHVKVLEEKHFMIYLRGLKYYNAPSDYKDKVLLLNKDKMAGNADTPWKIKAEYPYYIKLLTTSEIKEAISSDPQNTLFMFHVGPPEDAAAGKCFEMIFDVDGKLYYYNYRMITNDNKDGFNLNDFSNL